MKPKQNAQKIEKFQAQVEDHCKRLLSRDGKIWITDPVCALIYAQI